MLYCLYVIGFSCAALLPLPACYDVANWAAEIYFKFSKRYKTGLRENLKIVLGEDTDSKVIDRYALDVFKNFAKYLADFFKFSKITNEFIKENITIENREYLDECLADGKGAILVSIHIGNWEMGAGVIGSWGYPINAVVLEHSSRRINDFFVRRRILNGMKPIPVAGAVKKCLKVLKQNELLAIVGDKDYQSSGLYVDFFGKKAFLPKGPAVLAFRTGAPLICTILVREKNDKYRLIFEKIEEYVPIGEYEKDIKLLMRGYLKVFEKHIREKPDQWYVFNKVWNPEKIIL